MSESGPGAALVVGGSAGERERWRAALADRISTDAVADGADALARLDDEVEILLVHRDLPDQEAPAFVATARERGFVFRAALLTPERPEADVVPQGFDAWLRTPVEADLLVETVGGLLSCRQYDRAIGTLYDLANDGADDHEDPGAVRERIHAARVEADAALAAVEAIDRKALLANSPAAFDDRPQ